ncbi:hypothetical protein [Nocardioides zeicaulis]|uniref:Uncharacterized protein n=1 Tax=Nocardioides zeicaulis TaxID=1776857 RepID=A0ABV6DWW7_9ACTN
MKRMPDRPLRLLLNVPSVLAGLVIYLCVLSTLPAGVALLVLVLLVVAMLLPAAGRAEMIVVRALSWSRPASPRELELWTGIETLVEAGGAGPDPVSKRRLLVRRVARSRAAQVGHAGRAVVVVSPLVLQGLATNQISAVAVASEVARSRAEHHFEPHRGAVRGWVVTLPVRVVAAVLRPLLVRLFRWQPIVVAWQLRAVIGAVCVADGVAHHRAWSGLVAVTVVLISYAVPAAKRQVSRRAASRAETVRSTAAVGNGRVTGDGSPTVGVLAPVVTHPVETPPRAILGDRPRLYLVPTE